MIYSLINQPTVDAYPELGAGASLHCHGTVRLRVQVTGGAVLWQRARDTPGSDFRDAELPLLPGAYSFDQFVDAVRFRSLAAGHPAQLQVHALTADELPS